MANTSSTIFKNLKAEDTLISAVNFDGFLTDKQAASAISSAMRRSYLSSWVLSSNDDILHFDEFYLVFVRDENDINFWKAELRDDDDESIAQQTFRSNDLTAQSFNYIGPFDVPLQFVFTLHDNKTVIATSIDDSSRNPIPYLNRSIGGEISGDIGIVQHNINILSGNYVQTNTPDSVYVYSAGNSFIQAEYTKYGSASIGSRGFIILGVTSAENKVVLSTDETPISDIIPTSCYTNAWSIALDNYLDAQFSEISTVGADYVIFKKPFNQVANTNGKAQSYFIGLIKDDNALYCPTHPEIGNCIISTFRSNHIEGGSTHATAQFAHAEGRSTFAEGRFSHAEGHGTLAAGTGAHAEGMGSKALENRGVHAEGWSTVSFGNWGSHSEGCETSALGTNGSHAEGYQTKASDVAAHAEGVATKATGRSSHAEGYKSEATNYGAHAEGGNYNGKIIGGKASGIASHAEGLQTTASNQASHAEGEGTKAASHASHAEGYQTSAITNVAAHAEGAYTYASGNSSHAEGKWSYSTNTGAHAEGISCIADGSTYSAHAEGYGCYAKGKASHAEGYEVSAIGDYSHAAGYQSIANTGNSYANGVQVSAMNYRTIALGYNASTTQQGQFVWNGYTSEQKSYIPSNTTQGSFNINPTNGISGFYIGEQNLATIVENASAGKYDKTGGEISGDVKILSGNYIQTTDNSQIGVFSSKNAFLQAEAADGYGIAYTGSKGYCILSVDASNNRVQLSGDISLLQQIAIGNKTTGNIAPYVLSNSLALKIPLGKGLSTARVGADTNLSSAKFSIALSNKSSPSYYTIKSVDDSTGWVILNEGLSDYDIDMFDGQPQSFFTEDTWLSDDNAFYLAGFPEVGNANIKNFYSNHAEGGSVRAIGKYSHAEGRDTIANMRYSHAEGTCTVADEMAAHAEGFGTVASGRHAHSEGYLTLGSGKYAHAEGSYTQATAKAAHAEGEWTKARGDCSHAEGFDTQANAAYSHVAGIHANVKSTDLCAWCWSGISANTYYTSNGPGTFNINPDGGANGFYIGKTSLSSILANQTQPIVDKVDEISNDIQDEVYNTTISVMQQELVGNKLTEYVLNMPDTMVKNADLNRPLSFTAFKPGSTVAIVANGAPPERQFQYSFDMQTWNDYTIGDVIALDKLLDCVYFKVKSAPTNAQSTLNYYSFSLTGKIKAGGNIMSLMQPDVNQLATTQITITHAFIKLFIGQTALETMPLLPATDLKNDCYNSILSGCINLTSVVDLPATNIPSRAYQWMFKGCTSIYNTPTMSINYINPSESAQCFEMFSGCANLVKCNVTINTSNIASNCYGSMFNGCRRLENAPALPAQTLTTTNCYSTMFQNCSKINSISASFTEWNGDATKNWLNGVSSTGTFYHDASLSVDVVRSASTIPNGWELRIL